jgi:aspartate/tyrosine/aromatic aminotransferase
MLSNSLTQWPNVNRLTWHISMRQTTTTCTFTVLLISGCAHNPTGVDPTKDQWKEIAKLCKDKGHIPFFDVAYQGFATGSLDQDAWAPRYFVDQGLELFVAQSYSKNLGLYGERVGAISMVCEDKESATR